MNGSGVGAAGGVGKYLAEWISWGEPSVDMWTLDVHRFTDLHNNRRYLQDRVSEAVGKFTVCCDNGEAFFCYDALFT